MEAQITIFVLAIGGASSLLFYLSHKVDSLEAKVNQLHRQLETQHKSKIHLNAEEILTLFGQLLYLHKRQARVGWLRRLLVFGYITGYIFSIAGLMILLINLFPSITLAKGGKMFCQYFF